MKLEGSLDAFSLPDIFQLLSFTKKTGGLHLAQDGSDGVVFFAGGSVTGASADSSRQPLARRLVGSGIVDDAALARAVSAVTEGRVTGVARALLEEGVLERDLLLSAASDQAVDAVFDLLRWTAGDFAFVVEEPNPDDVGVSITVETVLADTEGRRAGWESVSEVVPSLLAVLTMPVVLGSDPAVSREEWSLLALVDGRRTVGALVDLTGSGQYAVVSTLAALVNRGLLRVVAADQDGASQDDHVAVVLRRQGLLAVLEDAPFVPVVEPAAATVEVAGVAEQASDQHDEPDRHDADQHDQDDSESPDSPGSTGSPESPDSPGSHGSHDQDDEQRHDQHGDEKQHEPVAAAMHLVPDQVERPDGEMVGGAHVPQDVVPARAEHVLPRRQAEFDDGTPSPLPMRASDGPSASSSVGTSSSIGDVVGATATAPDPGTVPMIERDPNVNRSLMLRLIAGVRGL